MIVNLEFPGREAFDEAWGHDRAAAEGAGQQAVRRQEIRQRRRGLLIVHCGYFVVASFINLAVIGFWFMYF